MRADRLLAILMYLQTRGRSTTDCLAEEFEVSRRTIIRDVYALRVAGFPVYTERGPYGGCYLHEEYRNTLTQLTTDEIGALFLSSIHEPLKDLGLSDSLRGALLKLTAALPESRLATRSHIAERIAIDAGAHIEPRSSAHHLLALHQASMKDLWVRVTFERPFGVMSTRRIAPYGLVARSGDWFVVWAGEDKRLRVDQISRVRKTVTEEESFCRPADFRLREFWSAWRTRRETARHGYAVSLQVRSDAVPFIEDAFGMRRGVFYGVSMPSTKWTLMNVAFADLEHAREALLALGGSVKVISPESLRRSIQDFAEQIRAAYLEG